MMPKALKIGGADATLTHIHASAPFIDQRMWGIASLHNLANSQPSTVDLLFDASLKAWRIITATACMEFDGDIVDFE